MYCYPKFNGWIRAMFSLKIILGSLNTEFFILLNCFSKPYIKHNFKVIKIKNKNHKKYLIYFNVIHFEN